MRNLLWQASWAGAAAMAALLTSGVARAQSAAPASDISKDSVLKEVVRPEGWVTALTVGANGSYNHSSNVVGVDDGAAITLGLVLESGANFTHLQHDWQSTLQLQYSQTRTAAIDRFVKSADSLKLRSTYVYHLSDPSWLGPFLQLKGDTSILPGYIVRADALTVRRTYRDGTQTLEPAAAQSSIDLTRAFEPVVLLESAGFFAQPLATSALSVDVKAGGGAQELLVRDGFALADDASTPDLDLQQLAASNQVGAVLDVALKGSLAENLSWSLSGSFFYPVYTSIDTPLSGFDAATTDINGKISVRLAKWASLDYVLMVKRVPLVLDAWQVQNGLILTTGFNIL